mmetsp:Transcript_75995/g.171843  ORF Transcript_75995/g.171843 Transcript_75995/m.171843 type:complete len:371 (-) Transcript_75995:716-1828(-)
MRAHALERLHTAVRLSECSFRDPWRLNSEPGRQEPHRAGLAHAAWSPQGSQDDMSDVPGGSEPGRGEQRHVGLAHEVVGGQGHDVVAEILGDDVLRRDAGDVWGAAQPHDHQQLVLEHVHHAHDALLAVGGEGVEHRPAGAAARGAQRHGLEEVGAAPDAAIDEDDKVLLRRARLLQRLHDLGQHLDARPAGVQLPAAVVREHAARQASLVGGHGVLAALHALQQDLHLGDALQPRHIVPAEAGVDVAADGARRSLRAVHLAALVVIVLHVGALLRELVPHVLLPAAQLRSVHRHKERLHAGFLELRHVLLRARALGIHVELREELLPRRPGGKHLLQGVRAKGREHVDNTGLLGGPDNGDFSVLVRELR